MTNQVRTGERKTDQGNPIDFRYTLGTYLGIGESTGTDLDSLLEVKKIISCSPESDYRNSPFILQHGPNLSI